MPGFGDSAVLILLALLLFGPKKLPQLARQLGKLMADFRRASNEFRTQMEEELRISEQAERQKQIAAIEAAAPATHAIDATGEEHPHLPPPAPTFTTPESADTPEPTDPYLAAADTSTTPEPAVPIATSGELSILPPSTGLPLPNTPASSAPPDTTPHTETELETETLHG